MEKISIILSVYNTSDYLAQCIESVLAQTYTDWELLIGDDGSDDGSAAICDHYATLDSRITVIHKENTGKPDTCNQLINRSNGEWIAFLDSDDWMEPDLLKTLISAAQKCGADCASCGWLMEYRDASVPFSVSKDLEVKSRADAIILYYDRKLYSTFWAKLFKRQLLQEPIPQLVRYEDQAVLYMWLSHGNGIVLLPDCLYHYRQRGTSLMNSASGGYGLVPITIECYRFVEQNGLLSVEDNKRIAIKHLIREAKSMVRNGGKDNDSKMQEIVEFLSEIQPVTAEMLDTKTYRRMKMLLQSVKLFRIVQRIHSLFVVGHREGHHELFT